MLALFPKTLNSIQEAVFVVHGRTEFETVTTLVSSCVILGLSFWLLQTGHGVVAVVVVLVTVEYAVTFVYYVLITRSIARLRWAFDRSLARRLVNEIKSFTGTALLGAMFARPEIILVSLMSTPREVGFYSVAVRISEVFLFVPVVFMSNVYPFLTRAFQAGQQRFREVQFKAITYTMAYCLPLSAGTCVLAGPIIRTLFGSGFGPSVLELQLLSANLTLYTLMGMLWRSVSARDRQDIVLRAQVIIVAARLVTGVALIAPLGSLGAAISATASSGFHVLLLEAAVRKAGAPARVLRASWRLAGAAGAMAALSWTLAHWTSIWIIIPIAATVYALGIVTFRAVPSDDIRVVRDMVIGWTTRRSRTETAAIT
jgi:O-antigen/teichoic acid export membrane protein